jgi:Leucine-rich repeat (LRR) protein
MGSSQSHISPKLELIGKSIKDLEHDVKQPHMLPTFRNLTIANLSRNKIETIPASIAQDLQKAPMVIETLETLNLSKNKFSQIPQCIFLLRTLSPQVAFVSVFL